MLDETPATPSTRLGPSVRCSEEVNLAPDPPLRVLLPQGYYMKGAGTDSLDTQPSDKMGSNNRSLFESLLLTLAPPVYLLLFNSYRQQPGSPMAPRSSSVSKSSDTALRDLPTHSVPLCEPAIVEQFLWRRPLRD